MIDSCAYEAKPLLTVAEALARILAALAPIADTETVALPAALGRVLAHPVTAQTNLPPERNAAMDGYAFAGADVSTDTAVILQCVGTAWAGRPFQGMLQAGQCVRIFTGAVVPPQADSVVMQEQVRVDGAAVRVPPQPKPGQNVRQAGEDVRLGASLCADHTTLSPADLGLLAAAGVTQVAVVRPLRITFFSTGDELVGLGQALASGQIYDSNRYLLGGLLADPRYQVTDGGVLADDPGQLEAALLKAAATADVLITTGGASVGEADYIRALLAQRGQVAFWKLAMKPGKPLAFGTLAGCHFFGLPGNPLAVMATFRQLVQPGLHCLLGLPYQPPLRLLAICTSTLKKAPGRQEFQCGIFSQAADGSLTVASAGLQGSHVLSTLHKANCYIVLPATCQGVQPGEAVWVEPFNVHS